MNTHGGIYTLPFISDFPPNSQIDIFFSALPNFMGEISNKQTAILKASTLQYDKSRFVICPLLCENELCFYLYAHDKPT